MTDTDDFSSDPGTGAGPESNEADPVLEPVLLNELAPALSPPRIPLSAAVKTLLLMMSHADEALSLSPSTSL